MARAIYEECREKGLEENVVTRELCEAARAYAYFATRGNEIDVKKAIEKLGFGVVAVILGSYVWEEKVPKHKALYLACGYLLLELGRLLSLEE